MTRNSFVANTDDELHCFQACYLMTVLRLTKDRIGMGDAERETGFVRGRRSWAFEGIRGFARRGLYVETIDEFNAEKFARDPTGTVSGWYENNPEERDRMIRESNLPHQGELVADLLNSPQVKFTQKSPTWEDLDRLVSEDKTVVLARVNHRVFMGKEGAYGHYVLVEGLEPGGVRVQDPGPPARPNHLYNTDVFRKAWFWPDEESGELIIVRNRKPS